MAFKCAELLEAEKKQHSDLGGDNRTHQRMQGTRHPQGKMDDKFMKGLHLRHLGVGKLAI